MTAQFLQAPVILAPFAGAVPTGPIATSVGSDVTFNMNGEGDKLAFIFQSPGTTAPDEISFSITSVSVAGTTGAIDCTLETMASDGTPSGTPVTNSATASVTASTTGVKTATGMAGTATVTRGTTYAVVLTAGAGWDRTLAIRVCTGSNSVMGFPYYLTKDSAGSWTKGGNNNLGYCVGLADSSAVAINVVGLLGAYTAAFQNFSDATNPDERGNRFNLAVPATIIGAAVLCNGGSAPGANDDFAISLYSSHTGTPSQLATILMDGDAQQAGAAHIVLFNASVALAAGTTYALTLKGCGTENVSLVRWDYSANAALGNFLGTDFYSTTRDGGSGAPGTGGNSFTDDNTKVYAVFPILSKFDDGAGGGGGSGNQGISQGLHTIGAGIVA